MKGNDLTTLKVKNFVSIGCKFAPFRVNPFQKDVVQLLVFIYSSIQ